MPACGGRPRPRPAGPAGSPSSPAGSPTWASANSPSGSAWSAATSACDGNKNTSRPRLWRPRPPVVARRP
eukprot:3115467-Alexandrium_andersonii.AAC.1